MNIPKWAAATMGNWARMVPHMRTTRSVKSQQLAIYLLRLWYITRMATGGGGLQGTPLFQEHGPGCLVECATVRGCIVRYSYETPPTMQHFSWEMVSHSLYHLNLLVTNAF